MEFVLKGQANLLLLN